MKSFWQKLNKPFFAMAPLAGITDAAFRYLCGKNGADVVYSEMISAAGLFYDNERTGGLLDKYKNNGGAKFVVQLFGNNPKHFAKAVKIVEKFKPDGIDINFGCPVPKIRKAGAGVELFQKLELSRQIVEICIKNTGLPISVKTRIKAGNVSILDFIEKMKNLPIAALMVHGRTLAQGFSGKADYEILRQVRKKFPGIFIANGGINNAESARKMLERTGADGIAVGQAACGCPWIFSQIKDERKEIKNNKKFIFTMAWEHAKLMQKLKGESGIREMRKHLCWYVKGLPNAAELRKEFVSVETLKDIKNILK